MTDALPRNAVLLVVDVQKGFDRFNQELHRNNPALEANYRPIPARLAQHLWSIGLCGLAFSSSAMIRQGGADALTHLRP